MRMKLLAVMVLALTGAGCISTSTRTEPPAPVYERGRIVGEAQSAYGSLSGVETTAVAAPAISVGVAPDVVNAPPAPEPATVITRTEGVTTGTPAPVSTAQSQYGATGTPTATQPATQVAYAAKPPAAASSSQPMSSAGDTLVKKADASMQSGDLTSAASHLERAVRVDPGHPLPWNRLAHVRFAQGSYPLAEELAQKSNALAGTDSALKRNNWELIAAARQAAGDATGAQEARNRAMELR